MKGEKKGRQVRGSRYPHGRCRVSRRRVVLGVVLELIGRVVSSRSRTKKNACGDCTLRNVGGGVFRRVCRVETVFEARCTNVRFVAGSCSERRLGEWTVQCNFQAQVSQRLEFCRCAATEARGWMCKRAMRMRKERGEWSRSGDDQWIRVYKEMRWNEVTFSRMKL